jgi:hypothetical protein
MLSRGWSSPSMQSRGWRQPSMLSRGWREGRKEESRHDRVQFYEILGVSFPLYMCLTHLLLPRSTKLSGYRSREAPIPARVPGPPLIESCSVLASAPPHVLMHTCMPALCRLGAAPAPLPLIPMGEVQGGTLCTYLHGSKR